MKRLILLSLITLVVLTGMNVAGTVWAQTSYTLLHSTFQPGNSAVSGLGYQAQVFAGQSIVGRSSGRGYQLTSGILRKDITGIVVGGVHVFLPLVLRDL